MGQMSKRKALKLLRKILDERKGNLYSHSTYPERRRKWERDARVTIETIFGRDSRHVEEIRRCFEQREPRRNDDRCVSILESMIYEIKNTLSGGDERVSSVESVQHDSRKVFLVHGHDGEVKQTVARFLEKRGLDVVILDEIASQGRTIIQKFEEHSAVGYAVVLMTPDDQAAPRTGGAPKHRPRQNVMFELGFFVAKLQRGSVCVIAKEDIEIPSNYWGVEYIPWDDSEGWKYKLLRELKSANVAVSEG